MNLRALAAEVISNVVEGASLSEVLPYKLTELKDPRDQAFLQAICYGVCRWYFRLETILDHLLDKPLKAKDQDIHSLLLVGLYQLIEMRVPSHAAVAETVEAAKSFKKIWAKGLINAVLRNYQRHSADITQAIQQDSIATYSHPDWIIDRLNTAWPDDWKDILIANNQHPPFTLRVNLDKNSREHYIELLAARDIEALVNSEINTAITVTKPIDVHELPGFADGDVSVQDAAAQLAAELLAVEPKQRVLDACAAPGGKTAHILELQPEVEALVAVDCDEERLDVVRENLQRLKLKAELICADAGDTAEWWDGKLFDRILLDAPCSASGVIRRHPDIKLLRRPEDITQMAKEQLRLLTALWPLLKPNGLLVYATCSVFPEENMRVLSSFLAKTSDVREERIKATWGKECVIGRQIFPGMHGMDGFYFACLRKC